MQKKLSIPYPIIVEGKYDRLRIIEVCSANIITTDGFGIFKKMNAFRSYVSLRCVRR